VFVLSEPTELPAVQYAFQSHADPDAQWSVVQVKIRHNFSKPYRVELELTSGNGDDPAKLIGQPCSLVVRREEHVRCVHGLVACMAHGRTDRGEDSLRVVVSPALEALRHRVDCRIFQDMTVPEVLDSVLATGLASHRRKHQSKLRRTEYPKREYIVQYRESDLAFVERLMGEEGIWYRFEQSDGMSSDDCELMVLFDNNEDAPEASFGQEGKLLPLDLEHERDHHTRVVDALHIEKKVVPSGVTVAQANWTHPDVLETATEGVQESEQYEPYGVTLWNYVDNRYKRSDAIDQARMRWQLLQGRAESLSGHSNVVELAVGERVLVEGASKDLDGEWLITSLVETGRDVRQGQHGERSDYGNHFAAQRVELPLRPGREAKPRADGVALAHVVGADGRPTCSQGGDDIHTDKHGRVRVKMTWDRTDPGAEDATTTCFLRVAQLWSGAGWGSLFLPRIGMEVVVSFLEGDPDRPLITGCVYNGLAEAPYALPAQKTKSYIRTQSSPGGDGYNELLFEDAKDHELVSLRAQRDHAEKVLRNQTIDIGADRAEHVQGNEAVEVRGTRSHTVHGAETLKVVDGSARLLDLSGDDTKLVAKNRELVVSQKTQETYVGGRKAVVQTEDRLEVADGAHKNDHITGQYNIVADEHFKVQQGSDELYIKDNFYVSSQGSVQLKNGGFHLRADASGNTTIDVGKQLTIRVGSAQIQLKSDGSVVVSGSREAKLVAGPNELSMSPAGADLKAVKAALSGSALIELKAPMITLN
jgi:type VI secretion system secreted protein VgrG